MKIRAYTILCTVVILLCFCSLTYSENTDVLQVVPGDEWSWSRGAYNTFSGTIDLSEWTGKELTVRISADLPYDTDNEKQSMPVFTSVNGKRIVMAKQSDTVAIIPDEDHPLTAFAVSFRLPDRQRINAVAVSIQVYDKDGNDLKRITGMIQADNHDSNISENQFYISADIYQLTVIFTIAAILVWAIVFIRTIKRKFKKMKAGE